MRTLIDSSATTIQAYLVLCSPIVRQVSLLLRHNEVLQGIVVGIGISNFLRAFLLECALVFLMVVVVSGHPQPSHRDGHPCTVDVLPGPTGVVESWSFGT